MKEFNNVISVIRAKYKDDPERELQLIKIKVAEMLGIEVEQIPGNSLPEVIAIAQGHFNSKQQQVDPQKQVELQKRMVCAAHIHRDLVDENFFSPGQPFFKMGNISRALSAGAVAAISAPYDKAKSAIESFKEAIHNSRDIIPPEQLQKMLSVIALLERACNIDASTKWTIQAVSTPGLGIVVPPGKTEQQAIGDYFYRRFERVPAEQRALVQDIFDHLEGRKIGGVELAEGVGLIHRDVDVLTAYASELIRNPELLDKFPNQRTKLQNNVRTLKQALHNIPFQFQATVGDTVSNYLATLEATGIKIVNTSAETPDIIIPINNQDQITGNIPWAEYLFDEIKARHQQEVEGLQQKMMTLSEMGFLRSGWGGKTCIKDGDDGLDRPTKGSASDNNHFHHGAYCFFFDQKNGWLKVADAEGRLVTASPAWIAELHNLYENSVLRDTPRSLAPAVQPSTPAQDHPPKPAIRHISSSMATPAAFSQASPAVLMPPARLVSQPVISTPPVIQAQMQPLQHQSQPAAPHVFPTAPTLANPTPPILQKASPTAQARPIIPIPADLAPPSAAEAQKAEQQRRNMDLVARYRAQEAAPYVADISFNDEVKKNAQNEVTIHGKPLERNDHLWQKKAAPADDGVLVNLTKARADIMDYYFSQPEENKRAPMTSIKVLTASPMIDVFKSRIL